jgi:hypothetical protein
MNISGLIRSLVGDLQAADSKLLELKVGQVVKGLVLQLLSDQEALINISGLVVRAKLETPLKQGDVTLLQVQPESNSSQILLKPLFSSDVQIADESMKDLLKSFTLKDVPANRQMVQLIQQEGVPLTKDTVQKFAALQQAAPEGVIKEEWTQAAVLAFKRGLPLTPDTVSALRQATSGPPAGTLLERLELQVASLLQEQPEHSAAATLTQLAAALKSLRAVAAAWTAPPPVPSAAASSGTAAPAAAPQPGGDAARASTMGGTPQQPSGFAAARDAASPGEAARPAASAVQEADLNAGAKLPASASQPDAPLARAVGMAQPQRAEPSAAGEPPLAGSPGLQPPALQEAGSVAARPQAQAAGAAAAAASAPQPLAEPDPNWIGRLLQSLGVEHEHQLAKMPELLRAAPEMLATAADSQSSIGSRPDADTVKSILLQLAAADDLPAPLKETVQQALQQITGQQLLLSSDRNSMFSHITMFVPFMDGSGQQSASVHIQSRKGQRGEVDANNCRLLFDLQMKTIGNTLVDVQVMNKIVSLQVHNDLPALAQLIDGSREEIAESLHKAGYQFFSLKCLPYPQFVTDKETGSTKSAPLDGTKMDLKSLYEPKPYKGVDYRA